ncbi:MAG: hypothetical protein IPM69_07310 [Ignavibacteria bacterium]|nr:hypothetical protein [Ignavibacteria bacterium]
MFIELAIESCRNNVKNSPSKDDEAARLPYCVRLPVVGTMYMPRINKTPVIDTDKQMQLYQDIAVNSI